MQHDLYKVAFSMLKGNNTSLAATILERIGSEKDFFSLSTTALSAASGLRGSWIAPERLQEALRQAEDELRFLQENPSINTIYFTDPQYSQRLLQCQDAPVMLYTLGNTNLNAAHVISIVGTRNCTTYGAAFIDKLVEDLHNKLPEVLIISGLALGCDITAHRKAMDTGTPTAGVVAHGLDTIYPAENRPYAARMVRNGGMIITDYPHNTRPHRGNFLTRNRIVAGMSDCVVVVESAAKRGGALHTARLGLQYNRDVFALPGRTSDYYSGGCNMLIRTNVAHLIENADDLISAMNWTPLPNEGDQKSLFPEMELSDEQMAIMEHLRQNGEAQINELSAATGIAVGPLMGIMAEMELDGLVLTRPGASYRLA